MTNTDIEELLVRCLEADDPAAALEAMCLEHPDDADRLREVFARIERWGMLEQPPSGDGGSTPSRFGDFDILERLGEGGMGIVYRAFERNPGREVALKVVRQELTLFEGGRLRFQREVEAAAKLSHPAILPVHAVGSAEGLPWFSMPVVRGCSLAAALERCRQIENPDADTLLVVIREHADRSESNTSEGEIRSGQSWTEAMVSVIRQIASALVHAHQHGVLHRDVKPSNILLTTDGRAMLVDFGLAFVEDDQRLTKSGAELGSLPYVPPEQLRGEESTVDPRRDEYSLGVTLYEALTFQSPFLGNNSEETRQRILEAKPKDPRRLNPRIPGDLSTLCLKAMAPEPEQRYTSVHAMLEDLDRFRAHQPIKARPAGLGVRLRRWQQRNPALTLAALVATVLISCAAFALWRQERRARLASEALVEQNKYSLYLTQIALAGRHSVGQSKHTAREVLARCEPRFRDWEWRHLALSCDATLRHIADCGEPTHDMRVSDDERLIACALSSSARVFEVSSGKLVHDWKHPGVVRSVAFSPSTALVATSCDDGCLRIYDAASGALVREKTGPHRKALFLDETTILAGDGRGSICWLDAKTADVRKRVQALAKPASFLALSHNRRLLAATSGSSIAVFETSPWKQRFAAKLDSPTPSCLAFAPQGETVLVEGMDLRSGRVSLECYDVASGERRWQRRVLNGSRFAVSANNEIAVNLLQIRTLDRDRLKLSLPGTRGVLNGLVFSRKRPRLWTLTSFGKLQEFDTQRAPHLSRLRLHARVITSIATSPDGLHTVSAGSGGVLVSGDVARQSRIAMKQIHASRPMAIAAIDDERVLSVEKNGVAKLLRIRDLSTLASFRVTDPGSEVTSAYITGPHAIVSSESQVRRFSVHDGSETGRVETEQVTKAIAFSQSTKLLALGRSGSVKLFRWSAASTPEAQKEVTLDGKDKAVKALAFAPDGRSLLASASSPKIYLLDSRSGELLSTWSEESRAISTLAFDRTGRRFFATGYDGTLSVFDPRRDASIYKTRVSRVMLLALHYCATGDYVALGGMDRSVHILHGKAPPPWPQ